VPAFQEWRQRLQAIRRRYRRTGDGHPGRWADNDTAPVAGQAGMAAMMAALVMTDDGIDQLLRIPKQVVSQGAR
jgi:hypothetical protein